INESGWSFTVNKKGHIRFGMSGMKGVGEKAVENIVEERLANGPYKSIYNFASRTNSKSVSKKVYENLVFGGAFDCFGFHRAQFFYKPEGAFYNAIERLVKYANDFQNNQSSSQVSLFGGTNDAQIAEPSMLECEEWSLIEKLKSEKEVIGVYLTGHPLDNYKFELENFCTHQVKHLTLLNRMKSAEIFPEDQDEFNKVKNRDLIIGGLVSSCNHRTTKMGKPFGSFLIEDYSDTFEVVLFGEDYVKLKQYLNDGFFLQLKGIVCERFKQKDNWEFKVNSIALLSELRDKMSKSLTIQLSLNEISDDFMLKMDEIVKLNTEQNSNRNCHLKFLIMDYDEETILEMPSKSVKISPSNEFLEHLTKLSGVRYKLN
ncbi:MAG: OB-fold nucleic acid binding domain-containing protein, partial [Daejeonella sp.]